MRRVRVVVWLLGNIAIYLYYRLDLNGAPRSANLVAQGYYMLLLSAPSSVIAAAIFAGVLHGLKLLLSSDHPLKTEDVSVAGIVVDTAFFLAVSAVGYWQWFIALPRVIKYFRTNTD